MKKITYKVKNYEITHNIIVFILYVLSALLALFILMDKSSNETFIALISTGAILATFGSAIATIGATFQQDLSERIFLNIDILIHDLSKTEGSSWRRWPFIKRKSKRRLLDEHTHEVELDNPKIKLDVGTHYIEIMIPTVKEDFLDLPIINNFVKLFRYRRAAQTIYNRKMKSEEKNEYGMNSYEENMAYECLYDTWKSIISYRLNRYMIHFGSSLTVLTVMILIIKKIFNW